MSDRFRLHPRLDAHVAPGGVVCLVVDADLARDLAEGLELLSVCGGIPAADLTAVSAQVAYLRKAAAEAGAIAPSKPVRHLKVAGGDPS